MIGVLLKLNKIFIFANPASIFNITLLSEKNEKLKEINVPSFNQLFEELKNISENEEEEVFIYGKELYTEYIKDLLKKRTNFKVL